MIECYATYDEDPVQRDPFLRCCACDKDLCTIEEGDHLSILVAVAEDHAKTCPGTPKRELR